MADLIEDGLITKDGDLASQVEGGMPILLSDMPVALRRSGWLR